MDFHLFLITAIVAFNKGIQAKCPPNAPLLNYLEHPSNECSFGESHCACDFVVQETDRNGCALSYWAKCKASKEDVDFNLGDAIDDVLSEFYQIYDEDYAEKPQPIFTHSLQEAEENTQEYPTKNNPLPQDTKPQEAGDSKKVCPTQPAQIDPPIQRPECDWVPLRDDQGCVTSFMCMNGDTMITTEEPITGAVGGDISEESEVPAQPYAFKGQLPKTAVLTLKNPAFTAREVFEKHEEKNFKNLALFIPKLTTLTRKPKQHLPTVTSKQTTNTVSSTQTSTTAPVITEKTTTQSTKLTEAATQISRTTTAPVTIGNTSPKFIVSKAAAVIQEAKVEKAKERKEEEKQKAKKIKEEEKQNAKERKEEEKQKAKKIKEEEKQNAKERKEEEKQKAKESKKEDKEKAKEREDSNEKEEEDKKEEIQSVAEPVSGNAGSEINHRKELSTTAFPTTKRRNVSSEESADNVSSEKREEVDSIAEPSISLVHKSDISTTVTQKATTTVPPFQRISTTESSALDNHEFNEPKNAFELEDPVPQIKRTLQPPPQDYYYYYEDYYYGGGNAPAPAPAPAAFQSHPKNIRKPTLQQRLLEELSTR